MSRAGSLAGYLVIVLCVAVVVGCCLRLMRSAARQREETDVGRLRQAWQRDVYTFPVQLGATLLGAWVSTKVVSGDFLGPTIFFALLQLSALLVWVETHVKVVVEPRLQAAKGPRPSGGGTAPGNQGHGV
ncbi:hypothetical protein DFJ64_1314 [Thermasporomyces composti]|jgi:sensor c-di-GMP phosphodiesterase-like protein|uniref:Uncharacterized protein n=1 Tax=Thermasporomyces composti TaxID=696763 RepID=A0A3D9V2A8_THECX|nr:hypothetical protein DFJ64_1314 [Thermasporomyces composti]